MCVEKQLISSAESAIESDGVPDFVEKGMEDMQERLLPEVIPPGVSWVTTEPLVSLLQPVAS